MQVHTLISGLGRLRQEDQEVQVILSYKVNLRLAWTIGDCLRKPAKGLRMYLRVLA